MDERAAGRDVVDAHHACARRAGRVDASAMARRFASYGGPGQAQRLRTTDARARRYMTPCRERAVGKWSSEHDSSLAQTLSDRTHELTPVVACRRRRGRARPRAEDGGTPENGGPAARIRDGPRHRDAGGRRRDLRRQEPRGLTLDRVPDALWRRDGPRRGADRAVLR